MSAEGKSVSPDQSSPPAGSVTSVESRNLTGRTSWDAIVDISRAFGPYLPWVIIVGGVIYGAYKFSELQGKASADARQQVQKELDAAYTTLRQTYQQIGSMNKQELDDVASMLKVHRDTVKSTDEQRQRYNDLHTQAEQEREAAAKARADADRAINEAAAAVKQLERERKAASDASADFERQQKEKLDELERKTSEVNQKATQFGELNRKLIDLATRVIAKPGAKEVVQFAGDILDEYSPAPEKLLVTFQKNPSAETAKALHNLIGLDPSGLEKILKQGLGFVFWKRIFWSGSESAFVGVQQQTTDANLNAVVIVVRENKVTDASAFSRMACVEAYDTQDWNQRVAYNLYRAFGDEDVGVDRFETQNKSWVLIETASDDKARSEDIYGSEKRLAFVTLEALRKQDPKLVESALQSKYAGFSTAMAMIENAKHFDPGQSLRPLKQEQLRGIGETLNQLLTAAVNHESPADKLAPGSVLKPDIFGRVAATVLKPGTRAVDVTFSRPHETASSTSKELAKSGVRSRASVTFEYDSATKEKRRARLTLTQENSDSQWLLANFEDPVASSPTAAD